MRVVVSYDISDDKRRRQVAKIMEGYGYRVQYSVFECDLNQKRLAILKRKLKPLVKGQEMDSIRFYPLLGDAAGQVQVLGNDMARSLGVIAIV
jgi:CRISPR-associated protein Cas2